MVKVYDSTIIYHPRKANVVVDALSRKALAAKGRSKEVEKKVENFELEILSAGNERITTLTVQPILVERIKEGQQIDLFADKMLGKKYQKEKSLIRKWYKKWLKW